MCIKLPARMVSLFPKSDRAGLGSDHLIFMGGRRFFKEKNSQDRALQKKNPRPITRRKKARTRPAEAEKER